MRSHFLQKIVSRKEREREKKKFPFSLFPNSLLVTPGEPTHDITLSKKEEGSRQEIKLN